MNYLFVPVDGCDLTGLKELNFMHNDMSCVKNDTGCEHWKCGKIIKMEQYIRDAVLIEYTQISPKCCDTDREKIGTIKIKVFFGNEYITCCSITQELDIGCERITIRFNGAFYLRGHLPTKLDLTAVFKEKEPKILESAFAKGLPKDVLGYFFGNYINTSYIKSASSVV